MSNRKFLILIVSIYIVTVTSLIAFIKPDLSNSIDIILEVAFIIQPIVWVFLSRRHFKMQLYSRFLTIGFILFFTGGLLEVVEDKFSSSEFLDVIEDTILIVGICFISYSILHITKITNSKLKVLSEKNKLHYINSIHDPLTTLYNKRYLQSNFTMIFNNNPVIFHNCVCVFIDLDNFKVFNDTQGHEKGDTLLKELGSMINGVKRKGDFAFRYGGEEFLIFFMNTHKALIFDKLQELRRSFRAYTKENFYHKDKEFTLSIGTTTYIYGEELTQIIQRADKAMYEAKHSGKDRISSI
jgi:diguanylate cyclase (GGDEF)-like protein